ncbi:tetratricopeptide repeat protein [Stakelama marina]|uniref:Tetratricopeptide repeat protein n=1 Tax=Stakelama marina TaxID=2826939 RepID=A0A8T4I9Q7_9SPHN|nr:tetratricopeptide repeat protein [Stakelama marina]MBR0551377.1 tetratricopeptide repeat protein [Stakelama marina]
MRGAISCGGGRFRAVLATLLPALALGAMLAAVPGATAQTNAGEAPRDGTTLSEETERQIRDFRWDAAIAEYRAAIAENPDNAEAWRGLGRVLRWKGRLAESRDAYRHAAAIAPDNPDAELGIALTYRYDRNFGAARSAYDQAVARWPDDPEVLSERRTFLRDTMPRVALFYERDLSFETLSAGMGLPLANGDEVTGEWQREERPDIYVRRDWRAGYQHYFGFQHYIQVDARLSRYSYDNPVTDFAAIDRFQEFRIRYAVPVTPDQVVTARYSLRATRLKTSRQTFSAHKFEVELRSQWSPRFSTTIGSGLLRDLNDGATSASDQRTTVLVRAGAEYRVTPRLQLAANYITNPDLDNTIKGTALAQVSYSWNGRWSSLYRFRADDYKDSEDQTAHYLGMRYSPGGHVWAEAGVKYVERGKRSGIYPLASLIYRF